MDNEKKKLLGVVNRFTLQVRQILMQIAELVLRFSKLRSEAVKSSVVLR